MGKVMFAVNLVNNKVVDNLLILLVSNFHGNRINGLRVIAVGNWSLEISRIHTKSISRPQHSSYKF